jgi:hypothetical protein
MNHPEAGRLLYQRNNPKEAGQYRCPASFG